MKYSIKEVADKFNITKHTLYYYEKIDLLPKIKRNDKGNRIYDETDILWINLICKLRDVNVPIQSIHEYIQLITDDDSTLSQRKEAIVSFEKQIDDELNKLLEIKKLIADKMKYYDQMELSSISEELKDCYEFSTSQLLQETSSEDKAYE